jgi:hypothetical protein
VAVGPPDLVVSRIILLPDGRVSVIVANQGPGDFAGQSIFVQVRDLASSSEMLTLQTASLRAGATITLQTQSFRIEREQDVQAIVDPFGNVTEASDANNQLQATLAPVPTPTPTPLPGRER